MGMGKSLVVRDAGKRCEVTGRDALRPVLAKALREVE
jgi:hypothetical protein